MAMDELVHQDAVALAELLAARKVTAAEVAEAFLDRIRRFDADLGAFITVDEELVARQAREADERLAAGEASALCGLPIALKDNMETAGLRTTGGSAILRDWVPDRDAPAVAALRGAGAVVVGKANLHEFAYGGTCTNDHYGAVRNPWDPDRVPGGSSGGSAVAVAAGMAAAALGTDTAGSVRLPAAQCGVVGFKPTYARTSIDGVIPLAWSLDHIGPMTRSVRDARLVQACLEGRPPRVGSRRAGDGLAGIRVGVCRDYFFDGLDDDVAARVTEALDRLADLGAELVDVSLPTVHLSNSATWTIILGESSAYHRRWIEERPDDYGSDVRLNLEIGKFVGAGDYVQAQRVRTRITREIDEALDLVDVLCSPTLPIFPPEIGQGEIFFAGKLREINPVFIRLTDPFNLTGGPAISVPCGYGQDGLPVGLQIASASGRDDLVLDVAEAYEAVGPARRLPPVG